MKNVTLTQIVLAVQKYKTVYDIKQAIISAHGEKLDVLIATLDYLNSNVGHTNEFKLESEKQWKLSTIKSLKLQVEKLESEVVAIENLQG